MSASKTKNKSQLQLEKLRQQVQVEQALERVRTRTAKMKESGELHEIIQLIFKELTKLGIDIHVLQMFENQPGHKSFRMWLAVPGVEYIRETEFDYFQTPLLDFMIDHYRKRKKYISARFDQDDKNHFYQRLFAESNIDTPQERKDLLLAIPWMTLGVVRSKNTMICILRYMGEELNPIEAKILSQFGTVFERSYTRIVELQQAEARARKASITAAIERLRARTIAMRESDELLEVVNLIHTELSDLHVDMSALQIMKNEPDGKFEQMWIARPGQSYAGKFKFIRTKKFGLLYDQLVSSGADHGVIELKKRDKDAFYRNFFKHSEVPVPAQRQKEILAAPGVSMSAAIAKHTRITIIRYNFEQLTEEEFDVLRSFAKAFDLSYLRFLELQQLEKQTYEREIAFSLERVRAASLAMQKSEDLNQVAAVVYDEMDRLNLNIMRSGIGLINGAKKTVNVFITSSDQGGKATINSGEEPLVGHPLLKGILRQWKKQEPFDYELSGKNLKKYYGFMKTMDFQMGFSSEALKSKSLTHYYHCEMFPAGGLYAFSESKFSQSTLAILSRFAKVFHQAYTRFSDLQKAEAQTREAQIEGALERVRSASMAMQSSDELLSVVRVIFEQLSGLGIDADICGINIFKEDSKDLYWYAAVPGYQYPAVVQIPYIRNAIVDHFIEARQSGTTFASNLFTLRSIRAYYKHLLSQPGIKKLITKERWQLTSSIKKIFGSSAFTKHGALTLGSYTGMPIPEEHNFILRRMAIVFDQSYRRYLDILKAEAQAREARIEAALDRVRNNAIAMDSSAQVTDVVSVIHQEMQQLGVPSASCYIYVVHESTIDLWLSVASREGIKQTQLLVDWKSVSALAENHKRWSRGDKNAAYDFNGTEVKKWYQELSTFSKGHFRVPERVPPYQQNIEVFSRFGGVGILNFEEQDVDELMPTLSRFGKSFEHVYTRFRDLQKAEAQTREAQVEVALQRIRSTALAMHHSSELINTVNTILEQVIALGVNLQAVHIFEFIDGIQDYNIWATSHVQEYAMKFKCPPFDNIVFQRWQESLDQGEDYFSLMLSKEQKDHFFTHFFKNSAHDVPIDRQQAILAAPVCALAITKQEHTGLAFIRFFPEILSEQDAGIMKRLAIAFEQAYVRFLDLEKAEALAKERYRQASLDRVRAEIASMRTTEDLQRITPLLWKELESLEVPFFRCGVFIVDEYEQKAQVLLTTPEGKGQVTLSLPFGSSKLVDESLNHWRKHSRYAAEWNREQFIAWMMELTSKGLLDPNQEYFGMEQPPEHLALHFVPFTQGMLYIGNHELLSDSDLELVQSLADAFSVAYARFEDFQQIEKTLAELQATQDQLIQSEKMASLGELTAGIAHEIQNPLNFVNNFSEISNELIFEIQEEFEKKEQVRDKELVDEVLEDLKQNLSKINHHGNRASSIVNGMLSHSRFSSGEKTLTDLNQVIDEYLRLSYHGLRAKDKSFQAKFVADLQEDLPQIMVISQDIGRVMLNLFNNAFYTVHKKKVQSKSDKQFMPTVNVSTAASQRDEEEYVEIQVQDNGQGMDEEVASKIFQPFFTTKPTGEGTGLGLSLSYDIITKGHGGTFEVESTPSIGTTFTIRLPIA